MGEGVHLPKPSPKKPQQPLSPASPRAIHPRGERSAFSLWACKGAYAPNQTPRRKTRPVVPSSTPGLLGFAPIFRRSSLGLVLCAQPTGAARVPRTLLHPRQVKVAAHCRAHTRQEAAFTEVSNRNRPLPA